MEEKEKESTTKMPYEQLEQVAMQLQQRLMVVENKLRSIDFAAMRLTWLFKVLENKSSFSEEYISKCSKEIEEILTIEEVASEAATDPESNEA